MSETSQRTVKDTVFNEAQSVQVAKKAENRPNAAPGGTIVLSGLAILLVAILAKKIKGPA